MKTKIIVFSMLFILSFFFFTCNKNSNSNNSNSINNKEFNIKDWEEEEKTLPEDIKNIRFYYRYDDLREIFININKIENNGTLLLKINNEDPICNFSFNVSTPDELNNILESIKYIKLIQIPNTPELPHKKNDFTPEPSGCLNPNYSKSVVPSNKCKEITFVTSDNTHIAMGEKEECIYQKKYLINGGLELFEYIYSILDEQADISTCPDNWHKAFEYE